MSNIIQSQKIREAKTLEYLNYLLSGNLNPDTIRNRITTLINRLDQNPSRIRQLVAIDRDSYCQLYSICVELAEALGIELKFILGHCHETINTVTV